MSDQRFYIDDFSDEFMPCEPSLDGWAKWLSEPDENQPYNRTTAPTDGERFASQFNLEFGDDIVATRNTGREWTFSRQPSGIDFMAVRHAEGLGWSPGNIIDLDDDPEMALREWFAHTDEACDDVEYVACATNLPAAVLIYRTNPPRMEVEWATAHD